MKLLARLVDESNNSRSHFFFVSSGPKVHLGSPKEVGATKAVAERLIVCHPQLFRCLFGEFPPKEIFARVLSVDTCRSRN
jgi:hypothetical protein